MKRKISRILLAAVFFGVFPLHAQDAYKDGIPVYEKTPPGDFFREWLVCGPFPNPLLPGITQYRHDSTSLGFYRDYLKDFGGETGIQPHEGLQIPRPDGRIVTWRRIRSYFPEVILDSYMNPPDSSVAYAAAIVRVPDERDVMAKISSNDGIRIWLNGEMILDHNTPGTDIPDRDFVPVQLKTGDNLFLLKISEGFGRWGFTFRLSTIESAQKEILEQLPYLIRPTIEKIPEGWSIFAGQKYRVELLPEEKPCTLTVLAPDGHTPEITFKAILGSSVFLSKNDPRLTPGGHLVNCRIFLENGQAVSENAWLFNREPETIQAIWKDFKSVSPSDSATFEGWAHKSIRDCFRSQIGEEIKNGHVPAFHRYRLSDVVHRYRKWETRMKAEPCLYKHIFPLPKQIIPQKGQPFKLAETLSLFDLTKGACQADVSRLSESLLSNWNVSVSPAETDSSDPVFILGTLKQARELQANGVSLPQTFRNAEAYFLQISDSRIALVGASDQGLHNGLITLKQLFDRRNTLPPVEINDWPAFPVRSAYIYTHGNLNDSTRARLFQFIDLKYNQLVLPTFDYFHLENPQEKERVQAYFNFLRRFHIEPVPYIALPGSEDWNEAVYLRDEPLVFKGDSARFAVKHLLKLPDSRPFLASARTGVVGRRIFQNGKDYEILFTDPPVFHRLPGSQIVNGDTVFFTGDIYDPREARYHKPCPSEPLVYSSHADAVQATVNLLHPKTIHIGHDEVGLVDSDSRCRKRNLPGYQLIADQLNHAFRNIKEADPNIDVQLWADSIDPYHNAAGIHLEKTADFLTRKLIVDHWFYDVNGPRDLDLLHKGAAFFLERGFRVLVCPWEHLTNHQEWERVLNRYGMYNPNMLGVLHTEWSGKDWGKVPTAMIGWCGKTWLTK